MGLFRNLLFVFILIGLITRLELWFILKKWIRNTNSQGVAYVIFFINLVTIVPIAAVYFGFDIAFFEYGISMLIWLIFDLTRLEQNKGDSE